MPTLVSPAALSAIRLNAPVQRFLVFAGIAVSEILVTSLVFGFPDASSGWNPAYYANSLAQLALLALPLFFIMAWPRRHEIMAAHEAAAADHGWKFCLLLNIGLFAALIMARLALSRVSGPSSSASLLAYSCLLLATGASMAFVAAPLSFWRRLIQLAPIEIAVAAVGACFVLGTSRLSQESWGYLSSATLTLSHWLLTLYEPNVLLDTEHRILAVNEFRVQVQAACSGYEGAGLIVAFLAIYVWVFRRDLRFPNALLLFPIGITVIWLLNALRIAALVSIGAHVSPEIAVDGFHSQGGWIGFLLVTLGAIAISRKIPFFVVQPVRGPEPVVEPRLKSGAEISLEFLAPFMALMVASVVASAFAPHDQWLYAVKVLAVGSVLWWFRGAYIPLLSGVSPLSIAAGLVVGLVWIATDPAKGHEMPLGAWLASLPAWLAAVWLGLRAFGSVVLVPVAEELAFRGYLNRLLISARFETVGIGEFRLLAFVGSTLAFGLMHQRWLAACLAGAVYALLMYRTKRLSDPIAAHVASNAAIMFWAIATEQWSLL
jgi:exosortase E/protease (VPEID-CTERM system)